MNAKLNASADQTAQDDQFQVTDRQEGGTVVISLTGEMDYVVEHRVRDSVLTLSSTPEIDSIVVDASAVTFIDPSGIRALLIARKAAAELNLGFRLVTNDRVLRVLALCGLSEDLADR